MQGADAPRKGRPLAGDSNRAAGGEHQHAARPGKRSPSHSDRHGIPGTRVPRTSAWRSGLQSGTAGHLYDYNWEKFGNVIEVYISGLRRKIDSVAGEKLIQTV